MKLRNRSVLIISLFFILPNVYAYLLHLSSNLLIGDYDKISVEPSLSDFDYLVFYILGVILVVMMGGLCWQSSSRSPSVRVERMPNSLIFIILLVNMVFTIFFDLGVVGKNSGAEGFSYSFIFSIVPLELFFYLYFCLSVSRGGGGYALVFNTLLFVALMIMRGWTSYLLVIPLFYYISAYHSRKKVLLVVVYSAFAFFLIYPMVDVLKYVVRGSQDSFTLEVQSFDYPDLFNKLLGRLSQYSNHYFVKSNLGDMVSSYKQQLPSVDFIRDFFLGFIPKKLLGITDFVTLNQLLNSKVSGTNIITSSFNFPFISRAAVYLDYNFLVFLVFIAFNFVLFFFLIALLTYSFGFVGNVIGLYYSLLVFSAGNYVAAGYIFYSVIFVAFLSFCIKKIWSGKCEKNNCCD